MRHKNCGCFTKEERAARSKALAITQTERARKRNILSSFPKSRQISPYVKMMKTDSPYAQIKTNYGINIQLKEKPVSTGNFWLDQAQSVTMMEVVRENGEKVYI